MPDTAKAELLHALGRLVRGLSLLFWGLGVMALIYLEMVRAESEDSVWLESFGRLAFLPAILSTVMIWRGLGLMRAFQPQERIWQRALDRTEALAVTQAGLSPFLFWWHQFPREPLFAGGAGLLLLASVCLLIQLNRMLRRLCAMLPDETLRGETKLFTGFNIAFLVAVFAGLGCCLLLLKLPGLPVLAWELLEAVSVAGIWFALLLAILPLAMTMALVWKIKEVIFSSLLAAGS
jgi:hypothetical protein